MEVFPFQGTRVFCLAKLPGRSLDSDGNIRTRQIIAARLVRVTKFGLQNRNAFVLHISYADKTLEVQRNT